MNLLLNHLEARMRKCFIASKNLDLTEKIYTNLPQKMLKILKIKSHKKFSISPDSQSHNENKAGRLKSNKSHKFNRKEQNNLIVSRTLRIKRLKRHKQNAHFSSCCYSYAFVFDINGGRMHKTFQLYTICVRRVWDLRHKKKIQIELDSSNRI